MARCPLAKQLMGALIPRNKSPLKVGLPDAANSPEPALRGSLRGPPLARCLVPPR